MSTEDIRKKLESEINQASWDMLTPHFERQALFIVAQDLDLIEVGVAMASNDVESVKAWQASWKLRPPTEVEIGSWRQEPEKKFAEFIIIQPFVLIQLISAIQ